jgi:hypothetical protein
MKQSILIIAIFTFYGFTKHKTLRNTKVNAIWLASDSSLKQRFIVNLLNEYEKKGRWVFVNVKRCDNKSAYEIIEPSSIYRAFSETTNNLTKKLFTSMAVENLYVHNEIFSCVKEIQLYYPKAAYELEGKKINMKVFNSLKKLSAERIVEIYFDSQKIFRKKFKKNLNEIIAACYVNNVKVITSSNGNVEYELFK